MKYDDLTPDQKTEVTAAIIHTWQGIAPDVFNARAEAGETGPMPQDEVIEVTLDADRVTTHGGLKDSTVKKFFSDYSKGYYDEWIKAAKIALPQKDWL